MKINVIEPRENDGYVVQTRTKDFPDKTFNLAYCLTIGDAEETLREVCKIDCGKLIFARIIQVYKVVDFRECDDEGSWDSYEDYLDKSTNV